MVRETGLAGAPGPRADERSVPQESSRTRGVALGGPGTLVATPRAGAKGWAGSWLLPRHEASGPAWRRDRCTGTRPAAGPRLSPLLWPRGPGVAGRAGSYVLCVHCSAPKTTVPGFHVSQVYACRGRTCDTLSTSAWVLAPGPTPGDRDGRAGCARTWMAPWPPRPPGRHCSVTVCATGTGSGVQWLPHAPPPDAGRWPR